MTEYYGNIVDLLLVNGVEFMQWLKEEGTSYNYMV